MFTGIVESVGRVARLEGDEGGALLAIDAPELTEGVRLGDSVAVNGACLTVTEVDARRLAFDVVRESLERTNLGALTPGRSVNLERALRADGRLDGHFVQGHVDATGRVRELRRSGADVRLRVDCPASLAELLVDKGSVTLDGVALTVVGVEAEGFDVALIPHTLAVTTLGDRQVGDPVNLEADILGKYVKRFLDRLVPTPS